jgi:Flp pilus assembly protein TadG
VNQKKGDRMKRTKRGAAYVEATLLAPWFLFFFIALFDVGFYYYATIATENAARAAMLANASLAGNAENTPRACRYAKEEMRAVLNIAALGGNFPGFGCDGAPLTVVSHGVTGPDGNPAVRVTVTYQSDVFPLPLFNLTKQLTITRYAEGRIFGQ